MKIYFVKGAKERVKNFQVKEAGATYSAKTGQAVHYTIGYQFSFVRDEAFIQLDDEKWDILTEYLMDKVGSEEYIGVYEGGAETSFYTNSLEKALHYAGVFNQKTILNWKALSEGKSSTVYYIQNPTYNDSAKVNYVKIIKKILRDGKEI